MTDSPEKTPRKTRSWVLLADRAADYAITVGGVLVIGAVLLMMVFLVYEVMPLFKGGSAESHTQYPLPAQAQPPVSLTMDEYGAIAAMVNADSSVSLWHATTGAPLTAISFDFQGKTLTAFGRSLDGLRMAFGFSDGTIRLGSIAFTSEVIPEDKVPPDLRSLTDADKTDGQAVYSAVPGKQIRKVSVAIKLEDEIVASTAGNPIIAVAYRFGEFGERPKKILAAADSGGAAFLLVVDSRQNLFTRKVTSQTTRYELPPLPAGARVEFALVNEIADEVYFAEKSGRTYRYNTSKPAAPILAETLTLTPPGVDLTFLAYLLGEQSIVVGGSDGSVNIYFRLPRDNAPSADGLTLVRARLFEPHRSAAIGFSPSLRGKTFATWDAQGDVFVRQGTSQDTLLRLQPGHSGPKQAAVLAPRLDGLLVVGKDGRTDFWKLSMPHPETSVRTLFGKIWYEGYPEPSYTWQSTGATEGFEPKLSLVPLIFGTLKATFYSLLFAIPVALLAAVYTSEFLPHQVRSTVKPLMEVMASIPSVVLGFVAALVLAPIVQTWLAAVLLAFVALPLCLIAASYVWQVLPYSVSLRLEGSPKFGFMILVVGVGLYVSYLLGPLFEDTFFAGSLTTWLNGHTGRSAPLIGLLLLPIVAVAVSAVSARVLGYPFKRFLRSTPMPLAAFLDLGRWVGVVTVTVLISSVLALLLERIGFDPRGSMVDTYVQRNTLIVGFAMGFAVIPLIYTLAEDALNSVPEHLRSASLACGATPWQTAIWIIVPTAISGIFSAIMIGMGRAVGETMIVVMCAGNTPLMDLNIFDGLRALSANIAVELPEAPKDGTLYRVLFLTGLVLFAMTFVINTVAELVRLRFRKRAMTL
jgi:phosphate transport system permease protein